MKNYKKNRGSDLFHGKNYSEFNLNNKEDLLIERAVRTRVQI